jgi:hypothetical protein
MICQYLAITYHPSDTDAPPLPPIIRPNTKWSKLLINSISTGVYSDHTAYTPDQCHTALAMENPSVTDAHLFMSVCV